MTSKRWKKLRSIFLKATDLPAEDRPAFLELRCGEDDALRRDLEQLLAEADEEDSLIRDVISDQAADLATGE